MSGITVLYVNEEKLNNFLIFKLYENIKFIIIYYLNIPLIFVLYNNENRE